MPFDCAVVYIARGAESGLEQCRRFFQSYERYPAGREHQLVVLVKGWENAAGRPEALAMARACEALVLELPDDGFDLGAYFRASDLISAPWLFFLNTGSFILHKNWLALILQAAATPGVGAVSCTGSWGSTHVRSYPWYFWVSYLGPRRGLPTYWRYCRSYGFFRPASAPPFPNPHLRTNAFLARREIWDHFRAGAAIPADKAACYALEHGPDGLSRFVEKAGLALAVAGADGSIWYPKRWSQSATFRSPDSRNLIIGDNQHDFYQHLPPAEKRHHEFYAWGRALSFEKPKPPGKAFLLNAVFRRLKGWLK